jgi:hypothetical protein
MKKIIPILLFISVLLISLNGQSQNGGRFQILRERMIQAKLREIKTRLNLDAAIFERFRPIYLKYNGEMSEIDFGKLGRLMKVDSDSLTTEEADQLIVNQLESAKIMISIREKYYQEFKTVLTSQQIVRLYQTEADIRKKVQEELRRRRLN